MKKSVYSLVLMDDVVEAIDNMAYRMSTSRSNLINQILAEHVALKTPEMQMRHIFTNMEQLLEPYHYFQVQQQAAESMMSIKSVLRYKYNPTIRYAITLERNSYEKIGEIRVISRTQSQLLQQCLSEFFALWTECEKYHQLNGWKVDQTGKFTRVLNGLNNEIESDELARLLVNYIRVVDEGMKIYFERNNRLNQDHEQFKNYFKKLINQSNILF